MLVLRRQHLVILTGKRAEYCFDGTVQKRELTEFCAKLLCTKLSVFCEKASVSSLSLTNNRLNGTH